MKYLTALAISIALMSPAFAVESKGCTRREECSQVKPRPIPPNNGKPAKTDQLRGA
ncbi:MAG: hypothetical protein RMY31_035070 [Dendronalium sp. ChiSLP03b]